MICAQILFSNIHQLRQAKLSFPSVHLLVGPFTDSQCLENGIRSSIPHVERSEVLRHCRWVDEVIQDAPVVLNESFLINNHIDYVAVEDGSSLDPTISKARLAGIDLVKSLGTHLTSRSIKIKLTVLNMDRQSHSNSSHSGSNRSDAVPAP